MKKYILPSLVGRGWGLGLLLLAFPFCIACNDEWEDEQYEQYISFKAPLNDNGVTAIYVPYTRLKEDKTPELGMGISYYDLPVIVAGSTHNSATRDVYFTHFDTLNVLNTARFGTPAYRSDIEDLYYKDMGLYDGMASYPEVLTIPSGQDIALLRIQFDFNTIFKGSPKNMVEKWVLPIQIAPGHPGYTPHPRKNYSKAMLRVYPYNDYSGNYSATTLKLSIASAPNGGTGLEEKRGYVKNDTTIFFYAGDIDETRVDRENYKVFFHFIPEAVGATRGSVDIYSDNAVLNGFKNNGTASYDIIEEMDDIQPYLKHRYVVIRGINYLFTDYTSVEGFKQEYAVTGAITLERQLNTQIPNEDQAIQW